MLLPLLLLAAAVLAVLVGLVMLTGSYKGTRAASLSFAVACFGATGWIISSAVFVNVTDMEFARMVMFGIYISPLVMSLGLLFYGFSLLKSQWVAGMGGAVMTIYTAVLIVLLVMKPELLYSSISLASSGNSVQLAMNWYYWAYLTVFLVAAVVCVGAFIRHMISLRRSRQRRGYVVMLCGVLIWLVSAIVFSLVLPLEDYSLVWIGPISVVVALVFCYFATLKYRIFELRQFYAQIFSYALVLAIAAMVYMLIFYLIFTALFRVPNPSAEIFVLNFIMIVIVLLLLPIVNEFLASARSIIARDSIDLTYIVKRLNRIATARVDLKELAAFLADHLHFGYVGFLVDGKVYGSRGAKISIIDITHILATAEEVDGVWQRVDEGLSESLGGQGIGMIATLNDVEGKRFGRMLLGGMRGKDKLDRRDVVQIETIINLIAMIVESEVRASVDEGPKQGGIRKLRRRAKANKN